VVPAEEVERAWECVRDGEQLADAELRLADGRPRHEVRPALMALLWSGRLTTDLTRLLSGESVLGRTQPGGPVGRGEDVTPASSLI
jgi:hypothetical protein